MENEIYKYSPVYFRNPKFIMIFGLLSIILGLYKSNVIGALIIFLVIIGAALIIYSFIDYRKIPKRIELTQDGIIIDNSYYSWKSVTKIVFTFRGTRLRHVIEIFQIDRTVTLSVANYSNREQLRYSIEKFANGNGIEIVIEDRGAEKSWF